MSDRPATRGVAGFWKETEMRRMKSLLLKGLRHKELQSSGRVKLVKQDGFQFSKVI